MTIKCRPERSKPASAPKPVKVAPHTRSKPKPIGKTCK